MEPTPAERAAWQAPFTEAELDMLGLRSVAEGGRLFCGVSAEQFAINGVTYQWKRGSVLKWGLAFSSLSGLSDMDVKDCFTAALKEISDCCDIRHEYVANPDFANIYVIRQRLDGAMGVLADCEIPRVGATAGDTRLRMRLDDGEAWVISENPAPNQIDLYRVILHELEHGHGLGHKPANIAEAALIAPTYSRTLRNLQKADKDELIRRYGMAAATPVPVPANPPVPPTPGSKPVNVTVEQDGKIWKGQLQRAT